MSTEFREIGLAERLAVTCVSNEKPLVMQAVSWDGIQKALLDASDAHPEESLEG